MFTGYASEARQNAARFTCTFFYPSATTTLQEALSKRESPVTTASIPEPQHTNAPTRNIFEDPAIQEAAKNDAFVRFVVKHWYSLTATAVAIALGMIAYNLFTTTAAKKRADATMLLSEIQEAYGELVSKQEALANFRDQQAAESDATKKQELTARIDEKSKEAAEGRQKLNLMVSALETQKPFDRLAGLYKGLVAGRFGDYETTKTLLEGNSWEQSGSPDSTQRSMSELAALGLAKSLSESEAHRQFAKDTLKGLAQRGAFVAVEAADSLSYLTTTVEEKSELVSILDGIRGRSPGQDRGINEIRARLAPQG